MRTCRNCGATFGDEERACPYCGKKVEELAESEQQLQSIPALAEDRYPMKWHRFLMVIMLIGGGLAIINGISVFAGTHYRKMGFDAASVYNYYPGLKACDLLYGIAMIGLGIFEIYVRNLLNRFRAKGPKMLNRMYILSIAAEAIYLAAASSALEETVFDISNLGSLAGTAVMLVINNTYYSRRKELFVN